jgi:hypothetical protein
VLDGVRENLLQHFSLQKNYALGNVRTMSGGFDALTEQGKPARSAFVRTRWDPHGRTWRNGTESGARANAA